MKIVLLVVAGVIALLLVAGLVIYLVGRSQPERHTASIRFVVPQPRPAVWTALTDYASMPHWWPAVKATRLEPRPDGTIVTWNTDGHGQVIGFKTREEQAPARLVREITGDDLPFGGTWTYDLAEENGGTAITITEDGFVKPPFFRGMMKLFMKPDATMRDFEKHFTARLAPH
jgi:uncharacterized protein YndB with AHSA1/START domain